MSALLEEGTVTSCKDLVEVKDINGAILRVKRYRGKNVFPCIVGNVKHYMEQVAKMEVRPDDVFITTFPKSGKSGICQLHIIMKIYTKIKIQFYFYILVLLFGLITQPLNRHFVCYFVVL